jgi:hypothetical protein
MHLAPKQISQLGRSPHVVGVVMGKKEMRDAGRIVAISLDLPQDQFGIPGDATDTGVDQKKIVSSIQ